MDHLDFTLQNIQSNIKSDKKMIMLQRGCAYVNVIAAIFQGYVCYYQYNNIITAICFGATLTNALWFFAQLTSLKQDLKFEKDYFYNLKLLKDEYLEKGVKDQFENTISFYSTLAKERGDELERYKSKESKNPGSINPDIQPASASNCT